MWYAFDLRDRLRCLFCERFAQLKYETLMQWLDWNIYYVLDSERSDVSDIAPTGYPKEALYIHMGNPKQNHSFDHKHDCIMVHYIV